MTDKQSKNKNSSAKRPPIGSRIVHVVGYFPPHLGGMEVVALEVSAEQARSGRLADVLTSNIGARKKPRYEKDWNLSLRRLSAIEIAHTPLMPSLLWRLFQVKKPAIIHLHMSQAYLPEMVWLIAKIRRIPYVAHVHLVDVQPSGKFGFLLPLYKKFIEPAVIRGATLVVALSPEQVEKVKRRYGLNNDKVFYLPNGVSQDYLKIGKKSRRPHKPLRLLFVGRIVPQKRLDRLIDALATVSSPVHLTIVGDGEDRAKIEKLTTDLGLTNVTFKGALYGEDVLAEYRKADVFVLPSEREGMPLALFEAMGSGLPVIGSDVQGIRDHLKDVGLLVDNPSPKTFAKAIDDFYKGRGNQYGKLSRLAYKKASEFSWPILVRKLEERYRQIERQPMVSPWNMGKVGLSVLSSGWWIAFLLLRADARAPAAIVNFVGICWLIFVPGLLTFILLKMRDLILWGKISLIVGFSLLELMGAGLLANTVLQWAHVDRPLDTRYILCTVTTLLAALLVAVWFHVGDWGTNVWGGWLKIKRQKDTLIYALVPLAFVAMSCLGAISLNNGGSDLWTMAMLIGIAVFSFVVVVESDRLNDSTIATSIYLIALALLFMTSLRGWVTTGHDIQQEFQVFEMTKRHAIWQIQTFRNPYNACLSITILPTIFSAVLHIADPYIFKILFQSIFAIVPVVMYLFVRKWTSRALAFLSVVYFVAFPTFFTDMPFLNRQEIAFVFFALMLYIIFQDQLKLLTRRILFLVFGTGLILSHYSTTYSVLVILIFAAGSWPVLVLLGRFSWVRWLFRRVAPSLMALHAKYPESRRITLSMIGILTAGSFIWTVMLTDTGGSTILIARQTLTAALQSFKEDTPKSNDTSYNLLSFNSVPPSVELKQFNQKIALPLRAKSPKLYYPSSELSKYTVTASKDTVQPLTGLGRFFDRHGLNIASFNFAFRQASAKLLQILVLSGFIFVLLRRTYTRLLDSDYVSLAIGGVVFVALQVVLPVLSVEYGLLRAFQQSLLLLGLFTVLGSLFLFAWLPRDKWRIIAASLVATTFLLSSTGVFTQATGGYYAQLNLSNAGVYYDNYYTQPQEISAINWFNRLSLQPRPKGVGPAQLQIEDFTYSRLETYTPVSPVGDIYPSLINKNAYVFLGYATVKRHEATIAYNSDLITYNYPIKMVDQQKNLVYSNGGTEIYK